jgi:hypothetical protein
MSCLLSENLPIGILQVSGRTSCNGGMRGVEVLVREFDLGVNDLTLDRGELAQAPLAPAAMIGPFDPGDDREA